MDKIQTLALGDPSDPKARMVPLYHGGSRKRACETWWNYEIRDTRRERVMIQSGGGNDSFRESEPMHSIRPTVRQEISCILHIILGKARPKICKSLGTFPVTTLNS
ncbi:hypothetical protein E2C01_052696 [Portunus trituberculatus]|uniref:Uncharacterized protein n=1 Tax=Portunus trituberculatus TaxID=210409 RepID=A0A5B7GM65_PORTR|nr:hypothetical protein [Portunus trituberculatus]